MIVVGAAVAVGFGRDEQTGRLAMTLAAPRPRWRALAAMIVVQAGLVGVVAALTGLGIWGGATLGRMDLATANIWGAAVPLLALGLFLGAVATVVVAASGGGAAGVWAAAGVGLVGYFINATFPMIPETADWARISPFYWYASAQPLHNGANWSHVAVLLAVSFPLFHWRDLRT